jgi:hypothetical protein
MKRELGSLLGSLLLVLVVACSNAESVSISPFRPDFAIRIHTPENNSESNDLHVEDLTAELMKAVDIAQMKSMAGPSSFWIEIEFESAASLGESAGRARMIEASFLAAHPEMISGER